MFINVNNYKDKSSDSEMIQAALDEAQKNGKAVIIPKFNERTGKSVWNIDKTLLLYDESTLMLQNAHIRLADGAICNMFTNSNARTELAKTTEGTQRNIHVLGIGKAVLDGGIHNGMYEDNGIARKVMKKFDHHITENCTTFNDSKEKHPSLSEYFFILGKTLYSLFFIFFSFLLSQLSIRYLYSLQLGHSKSVGIYVIASYPALAVTAEDDGDISIWIHSVKLDVFHI